MDIFLLIILVLVPIVYFLFFKSSTKSAEIKDKKKNKNHTNKKTEVEEKNNSTIETTENNKNNLNTINNTTEKPISNKNLILNSFKESKEISNITFSNCGKAVLFNDDKKFYLLLNSKYTEKSLSNLYSKSIENDVISDVAFSIERNLAVVALKNSKELIFYELKEEENKKKLKFFKIENKRIKTERKYDIKKVAITKDGFFAITSGSGQDTQIQIFDIEKSLLVKAIDINEIENEDIKMTPNSDFVTISTSLHDISPIALEISKKNTKNTNVEETVLKAEKKNSLSIKEPIHSYDFSNNSAYFHVLTKGSIIKIFQNYGNFPDSKSILKIKPSDTKKINNASCYITSDKSLKVEGYIAYCNDSDLIIYNIENDANEKTLSNILDYNVLSLKLVNQDRRLLCLVAFRNGRISTIDTEIKL